MNNSTADRRLPLGLFPGQPMPRLYDRVVEVLRTRRYSRRTEQTYCHWVKRFNYFHTEDDMLIRIMRRDKTSKATQLLEDSRVSTPLSDNPAACYAARKATSGILCGSA